MSYLHDLVLFKYLHKGSETFFVDILFINNGRYQRKIDNYDSWSQSLVNFEMSFWCLQIFQKTDKIRICTHSI